MFYREYFILSTGHKDAEEWRLKNTVMFNIITQKEQLICVLPTDRNNVPEREKIIYYSNAEGDLIKEDLPQNLKSAKETLFREGSGGHEFLVTFMEKEYISIENSFSSDNQEYLDLDFEPHMFFEYGVDNPNVSLAYNKAVRNALALKLTKRI